MLSHAAKTLFALSTLLGLTTAHFLFLYPPSRGDNEVTQAKSPCGGLNTPTHRTQWPLTGGQILIESEHPEALMVVYLSLASNPGDSDFQTVIKPEFNQLGLGKFCWNKLDLPEGIQGVKEGQNATIQIRQQSHDSSGWLYNCADITFTANAPTPPACSNGTGVSAEPAPHTGSGTGSGNTTNNTKSGPPTVKASASSIKAVAGSILGAAALIGVFLM